MTCEHHQEFFIYVPTKGNIPDLARTTSQDERSLPPTDWVRIPINEKVEIYAQFRDIRRIRGYSLTSEH